MSQARKSINIKKFYLSVILYCFLIPLAYAEIIIDPIHIELKGGERKKQVKLYNNSSDEYIFRSGIIRRQNNGQLNKESRLYLTSPPLGLLKSNSNIELDIIKLNDSIQVVDEKVYLSIQLIPKYKEDVSVGLVIPLMTTVLVEIKRKE